ncbi:MAG: hypothetical protein QJR03_15760 [Sphaerobacter sp.]|nr:hypothetical protein [Sphaerobacter sp.]
MLGEGRPSGLIALEGAEQGRELVGGEGVDLGQAQADQPPEGLVDEGRGLRWLPPA